MAIGNTVSVSTTSYVVADPNYKITATVYATEKSVSKSLGALFLTASVVSRMTVRIVPSLGLETAA